MKMKAWVLAALVLAAGVPAQANAAGCLKGAAIGGIGGHFVGHGHAVLGAVGGCVAGRHLANQKAKEDAAARLQTKQAVRTPA